MAEIRALPKIEPTERAARLMEWSRDIAIKHRPNMVGFVLVAWDKNGDTSICGDTRCDDNPIPSFLLPSWLNEHIRAEFVTAGEVRGVLRDEGFLAPPSDPPA